MAVHCWTVVRERAFYNLGTLRVSAAIQNHSRLAHRADADIRQMNAQYIYILWCDRCRAVSFISSNDTSCFVDFCLVSFVRESVAAQLWCNRVYRNSSRKINNILNHKSNKSIHYRIYGKLFSLISSLWCLSVSMTTCGIHEDYIYIYLLLKILTLSTYML